ncbi:DDB1- and CUL4-associated factor 12 [Holothuria leucospilota]|uniref:DDB1- and CUL4-associated factor 12 n=1 Tax=Holothuria leucospilota TaxID=206669 RepID=A0A9Q1BN55_HOLLE|nr:DDB1- and CUL4-associated factor 12 [Holothuria leucospilota]
MEKKQWKRFVRLHPKWPVPPNSVVQYLQQRSLGSRKAQCGRQLYKESFSNRRIPYLLEEKEYSLGEVNKVFASQWISDHAVVMGTKCNKLIVLYIWNGKMVCVPMISSTIPTEDGLIADEGSGIHAISLNPSQTCIATGADNPNNLGVYAMPDFDPLCVGEACHRDWIFDLKWLDDEFIVTGSRDGTIALWSVADCFQSDHASSASTSKHKSIRPRCHRHVTSSAGHFLHEDDHLLQKVRALEFNSNRKELASVVVSSGCICFWDVCQFREVQCRKLHHGRENVCLALSNSYSLYAVGSQSHITLLDSRRGKTVCSLGIQEECSGVRSVNFQGDILSAGTGMGAIKFIDVRKMQYLRKESGDFLCLQVGDGWLSRDDIYYSFFAEYAYPNAIYTHCFDDSGTRLFAAGGPLPTGLTGNYAGLFQ